MQRAPHTHRQDQEVSEALKHKRGDLDSASTSRLTFASPSPLLPLRPCCPVLARPPKRCLNLGSYNYLGFAANDAYCTPKVVEELRRSGASTCSPGADAGRTEGHVEMEQVVAGE